MTYEKLKLLYTATVDKRRLAIRETRREMTEETKIGDITVVWFEEYPRFYINDPEKK